VHGVSMGVFFSFFFHSSCAHLFSLSVVFCSFHAQYSPSLTSA
jgi:hypothetical protein